MKTQDRARVDGEKRYDWTIQVAGERYIIITKRMPFKPKGELLYAICDKESGRRGPCNLVGQGWDMQSHGPYIGARALHVALLSGKVEISHRNNVAFHANSIEVKP